MALVKEVGYQRNLLASNLRTSKTMTIGVVVPFISRHFFSEAIDGIEQAAYEMNYRVIIAQTNDDFEKEKKIVNGMYMNRIDGLLLSPTLSTRNGDHLEDFIENEIPVVLFDRYYENADINIVRLEDRHAAYSATRHLIENGCRHLVHLTGNLDAAIYQQRLQGFKDAVIESGLEFSGEMVHSIPLLPEYSAVWIEKMLSADKVPDGIMCVNDVTALGIMKYLDENTSLKVPDDIAITGFSNEPASNIVKPGLTTVDQHSFEMGRMAARLLLNSIENKEDFLSKQTIIVKSSLLVRGSSLKSKERSPEVDKVVKEEPGMI